MTAKSLTKTRSINSRKLAIRQRLKDDFLHYAPRCLKIRTKDMRIVPLAPNPVQLHIHEALEHQIKETGRVRVLILKGRQEGCSTYVEGRFYWKVTHRKGARAYILTHEDDATKNLFEMAERYHQHCPVPVQPHTGTANAKELWFDLLDSGYRVGTAGKKETGRSGTVQFFHGSEVAFWPNAETHMAGVVQSVPDLPGTEIILESTSAGAQGMFFQMCKDAAVGIGEYRLIFIPWFWDAGYRKDQQGFEPTEDERAYGQEHGLDNGQLAWRRAKIHELHGAHVFRREYPATVEEAFLAEVPGALWKRAILDSTRVASYPEPLTRIVVSVDPATTKKRTSNKTAIGVEGKGRNGHGYQLDMVSGRFSPDEWANHVVRLFDKWQADCVVYEGNQGGDMIPHTLHGVRKGLPCRSVHASRGKQTRAEPIANFYNEGTIHHVGRFVELEDQQCTWVPGEESPDELDASVWGFWELMIAGGNTTALPFSVEQENPWP